MRKILSHLSPRHLDDTLALHLLASLYPNVKFEFVHPQGEELERYKNDKETILVDVGGEYNPDRLNFDHHQDLSIPSSVVLVINHFAPKLLENERIANFIEFVDKIDRFGFPKVAKEYNIPADDVVSTLMNAYLTISQRTFEEGIRVFEGLEEFEKKLNEVLNPYYPIIYIDNFSEVTYDGFFDVNSGEIYLSGEVKVWEWVPNILKEKADKIKEILVKGRIPVVNEFGEIGRGPKYNDVLAYLSDEQGKALRPESLSNPYTMFFVKAVNFFPRGLIKEYINNLEEQERIKIEVLSNVKKGTFWGHKAIIDTSETPLRTGEYFKKYPNTLILIQRNSFDKNQTSIVKNTKLPDSEYVNLEGIYKVLGEDKKVFTHKTGFITVLNMPIEEVIKRLSKEGILQLKEGRKKKNNLNLEGNLEMNI